MSLDEHQLASIANDARIIADKIVQALDKLRTKGSKDKWQSFRKSLSRIWNPRQIDDMAARMDRCSFALSIALLSILKYDQRYLLITQC